MHYISIPVIVLLCSLMLSGTHTVVMQMKFSAVVTQLGAMVQFLSSESV